MSRFRLLTLVLLLGASWCLGQDATTAAQVAPSAASAKVVGHGSFPVIVKRAIDSSKLKEGDQVEVEVSGPFKLADGTLVPKGSKVAGHVTEAKSRSKGDAQSELAITFDKVSIMGGRQFSIKGMVQAVFPPADEAPEPLMAGAASAAAGGGVTGGPGVGSATVGTVNNAKTGSNMDSSAKPQAGMNTQSVGVQGMRDLQLSPDGVLSSSKGKQVKLGQDVRMIVHVDILE
jgi:hypothetical protein